MFHIEHNLVTNVNDWCNKKALIDDKLIDIDKAYLEPNDSEDLEYLGRGYVCYVGGHSIASNTLMYCYKSLSDE